MPISCSDFLMLVCLDLLYFYPRSSMYVTHNLTPNCYNYHYSLVYVIVQPLYTLCRRTLLWYIAFLIQKTVEVILLVFCTTRFYQVGVRGNVAIVASANNRASLLTTLRFAQAMRQLQVESCIATLYCVAAV